MSKNFYFRSAEINNLFTTGELLRTSGQISYEPERGYLLFFQPVIRTEKAIRYYVSHSKGVRRPRYWQNLQRAVNFASRSLGIAQLSISGLEHLGALTSPDDN
ncbi:hypothetical protein [Edwardsiella tarda]|uniref:hypothetical protein n=1 Tax=Edwardsiella tarda TaxID=636 RepID=UPI001266E7F9|nr:hypothetical protein [Edwardsiella tarda]